MLAAPFIGAVMAEPTQGQKVPITITWTSISTVPDVPKIVGNTVHNHGVITWGVAINIDYVPTYTGIAIADRYVVITVQKDGANMKMKEVYDMSIDGEDGGFVGSALILMEGVMPTGGWEKSKAHGLLNGYGAFEGQTINAGHHWAPPGPIVWTGYLLKP